MAIFPKNRRKWAKKRIFHGFFQILTVELKKRIANFYSIQFLAQN